MYLDSNFNSILLSRSIWRSILSLNILAYFRPSSKFGFVEVSRLWPSAVLESWQRNIFILNLDETIGQCSKFDLDASIFNFFFLGSQENTWRFGGGMSLKSIKNSYISECQSDCTSFFYLYLFPTLLMSLSVGVNMDTQYIT